MFFILGAELYELNANCVCNMEFYCRYTVTAVLHNISFTVAMIIGSYTYQLTDHTGERGNWSEAGCDVAEIDEESGLIVCECNHLTNFACLIVSM